MTVDSWKEELKARCGTATDALNDLNKHIDSINQIENLTEDDMEDIYINVMFRMSKVQRDVMRMCVTNPKRYNAESMTKEDPDLHG